MAFVLNGPLVQHVEAVKRALPEDSANREYVLMLLNKLAERVEITEQQRSDAVAELKAERDRCQASLIILPLSVVCILHHIGS